MPNRRPGPSIKNPKVYEALRDEGNSKEKSARIASATRQTSTKAVARKGGEAGSYDDMTVAQLRRRAAEIGIDGRSSMKKAQLIRALRSH